jgi:hypothetical protein
VIKMRAGDAWAPLGPPALGPLALGLPALGAALKRLLPTGW